MTWLTFKDDELRIELQLADETSMIIVGEVTARSRPLLREALEAALMWPSSRSIQVNIMLATFIEEIDIAAVLAAQQRAQESGRQFTIS